MNIYGVISDGVHTDVSSTLKGAKRYAALNGFEQVSVRYNCGYVAQILFEKVGSKWIKFKTN